MYIYIFIYTYTSIFVCTHTCIHIYIHMYVYTYTYIFIQTYMCMSLSLSLSLFLDDHQRDHIMCAFAARARFSPLPVVLRICVMVSSCVSWHMKTLSSHNSPPNSSNAMGKYLPAHTFYEVMSAEYNSLAAFTAIARACNAHATRMQRAIHLMKHQHEWETLQDLQRPGGARSIQDGFLKTPIQQAVFKFLCHALRFALIAGDYPCNLQTPSNSMNMRCNVSQHRMPRQPASAASNPRCLTHHTPHTKGQRLHTNRLALIHGLSGSI